jgi:hypothetical protein
MNSHDQIQLSKIILDFEILKRKLVPMVTEAVESLLNGYRKVEDYCDIICGLDAVWILRYTNFFNVTVTVIINTERVFINSRSARITQTMSILQLKAQLSDLLHKDGDVFFYHGRFMRFMCFIAKSSIAWRL